MSVTTVEMQGVLGLASGENQILGLYNPGLNTLAGVLQLVESPAGSMVYGGKGTMDLADALAIDQPYEAEVRICTAATSVSFAASGTVRLTRGPYDFFGGGYLKAGNWLSHPYIDAPISGATGGNTGFGGTNTVTLSFADAGGGPVPNVVFSVLGVGSAVTDGNGVISVNIPNGTYTLSAVPTAGILWPNVQFTVNGDTAVPAIHGSVTQAILPASGEESNCHLVTRDGAGVVTPAMTVTFRMVAVPSDMGGEAFLRKSFTRTSDGQGILTVQLRRRASYQYQYAGGPWSKTFTIADADTFAIPASVGGTG